MAADCMALPLPMPTPTIGFGHLGRAVRHDLGLGAWVDVLPNWMSGSELLMEDLETSPIGWRCDTRWMYGRLVRVPRVLADFERGDPLPHPALDAAREALNARYVPEWGEPFVSAGIALYRDGKDSVSWHGDRYGRGDKVDTLVAILALGHRRPLVFRKRGDGNPEVLRLALGQGDLAVMGGTCQRTFDHMVAKTDKPVGSRITVQFRMWDVH